MSELSSLEPDVRGPSLAWLLPHEGHLHIVQAMHALHASAGNTVAWHWASPVSALSANTIQNEDQSHRFDWVFDVHATGARRFAAPGQASAPSCRNEFGRQSGRDSVFQVLYPPVFPGF